MDKVDYFCALYLVLLFCISHYQSISHNITCAQEHCLVDRDFALFPSTTHFKGLSLKYRTCLHLGR